MEVSGREDSFKLTQSPGSFYIGNMCALRHNVVHGAHAPGSCGAGLPSEQFQIAVMLRSDVFRECRARKINATPGPAELYDLVNLETARMIAERPFLPPGSPRHPRGNGPGRQLAQRQTSPRVGGAGRMKLSSSLRPGFALAVSQLIAHWICAQSLATEPPWTVLRCK